MPIFATECQCKFYATFCRSLLVPHFANLCHFKIIWSLFCFLLFLNCAFFCQCLPFENNAWIFINFVLLFDPVCHYICAIRRKQHISGCHLLPLAITGILRLPLYWLAIWCKGIKGVGTPSSPSCKHTNVLGVFNKQQRRKRSHGHRYYNKKTPNLDSSIDTFANLIDSIDQPQGVHKTKTTLFSISLPKLRELQSLAQESTTMTMNLLSIELQPSF